LILKSHIVQFFLLVVFCTLSNGFIEDDLNSFGLTKSISLSEQENDPHGISSSTELYTPPLIAYNGVEQINSFRENRPIQRTFLNKKNFKYTYLNARLIVRSDNPDVFYYIIPQSCQTNNLSLRILLI